MILYAVAVLVGVGLLGLSSSIRVVTQFERGVVFRFGRVQPAVRGPGLMLLIPIADRLEKVNMQIKVAQTSLRSIIGKSELDDLLSNPCCRSRSSCSAF